MKILITGSSGMLGTELCGLLKQDHEVAGIDMIGPQSAVHSPQKFYDAGLTEKEAVDDIFEKERPEIVIHAAAWTDVDGCELDPGKADLINSKGTLLIAEMSRKYSAALIYISTDFVFDGKSSLPYKESDATGPLSVYGKSKLNGEEHVKNTAEKYIIIRTSWMFGRYGKNFVDTIRKKAKTEKELKVVNDQKGTPTYAKDLSSVIARLLLKGITKNEIYHFSNKGECTWYEFAAVILSLIRSDGTKLSPVSTKDISRPAARPAFSVLDCGKIRELLGFEIRTWKEALSEYLDKEPSG